MGETSKTQIKSVKQYSKLNSIEHIGMSKRAEIHFEDLEYLNALNIHYFSLLSNVTKWGRRKLAPSELMDNRFGRSTKQIISNQFIHTSHC